MKKTLKIILLSGLALLLVGALIFTVAFAASGFDFQFLSNVTVIERRFEEKSENPIESVAIDYENAAIEVRVQDGISALAIEYPQPQNKKGENVSEIKLVETDGKLSITENRKWQYQLVSWDFSAPTVVLHLPAHRTYELDLSTNNGKITLQGEALNANGVSLSSDNGEITSTAADVFCTNGFTVETNNGKIDLSHIEAASLTAQTDNGAITLSGCNVTQKAYLETDNGSIVLSGELKANEFVAETDNGAIRGSSCVIYADKISLSTNIGDVTAKIAGSKADYTIVVEHNLGDANLLSQSGGGKNLSVQSDIGDIQIDFIG